MISSEFSFVRGVRKIILDPITSNLGFFIELEDSRRERTAFEETSLPAFGGCVREVRKDRNDCRDEVTGDRTM